MSDRTYPRLDSGAWHRPVMDGYRMQCCDCGLVHRVDFAVSRGRVLLRVCALPKATASARAARTRRFGSRLWRLLL